jgi:hypothetical protein
MLPEIFQSFVPEAVAVGCGAVLHRFAPTGWNWVRDNLAKVVDVTGEWVIKNGGITLEGGVLGVAWTTTVTLKQTGTKISGSAVAKDESGDRPSVNYKISGTFENDYLSTEWRDIEKGRFSVSVFLLMLQPCGTAFVGHRLFSGQQAHFSRAVKCTWSKQGFRAVAPACGRELQEVDR